MRLAHSPTIYVGDDAVSALIEYLKAVNLSSFCLVADRNTYAVLGRRAEAALQDADLDVAVVLIGENDGGDPAAIVADELHLVQATLAAPAGERTYLAVGSGTLTDITRFLSFRSRNRFISLPTAPSMDGYATSNNTLTIAGLKISVPGHAPEAIFCDIPVLSAAPRIMIAAGLADTLAKFISVNDLRLGHLLWGERADTWAQGDAAIANRMEGLAQEALARADEIARADPAGIELLIRALIDSGLSMADFGNSMPGAGSEHHISHCWEMRHREGSGHTLLHGTKVGVGTVMAAEWYAEVREMTQRDAANRLAEARWPDPEDEIADIQRVYGRVAPGIIEAQKPFLYLGEEQFRELKWRIIEQWEEVRAIAAYIPPPQVLSNALRACGGPGSPEELGLPPEEIEIAKRYAHFTRPRFTIARLRLLLGL